MALSAGRWPARRWRTSNSGNTILRPRLRRGPLVAHFAERAGVAVIDEATLQRWQQQSDRTTFLFDVRSPEEYAAGHYPGSLSAPGGQLVQEIDHFASVRGAHCAAG